VDELKIYLKVSNYGSRMQNKNFHNFRYKLARISKAGIIHVVTRPKISGVQK